MKGDGGEIPGRASNAWRTLMAVYGSSQMIDIFGFLGENVNFTRLQVLQERNENN